VDSVPEKNISMTQTNPAGSGFTQRAFLWAGRLLGLAVIALFVVFFIGEGGPDWKKLSSGELAGFACLFAAMLSYLAGWKWPRVGAIVALVAMAGFYTANYLQWGQLPGGWVFPLMYVPSILYILGTTRRSGISSEKTQASADK
jgi:hypothetical protein